MRVGEVRPKDVDEERAAFISRLLVLVLFLLRFGIAPAPNELHAALRQISMGKAAGADEVTAELLKFGGACFWVAVVCVCHGQWLLVVWV